MINAACGTGYGGALAALHAALINAPSTRAAEARFRGWKGR
jgi:hypothetical protein